MSTEGDQIRSVAERIARRLAGNDAEQPQGPESSSRSDGDELSALRVKLAELQKRLAHIESHISHDEECETSLRAVGRDDKPPRGKTAWPRDENGTRAGRETADAAPSSRPLWMSGMYLPAAAHPSEERFEVGEAVSELVDYFEREKSCTVEPGGKPCDHCGMCSSRGF